MTGDMVNLRVLLVEKTPTPRLRGFAADTREGRLHKVFCVTWQRRCRV